MKTKGNVSIYKNTEKLIKETNLTTEIYFDKYYFTLINWKENKLNINGFLVTVQISNINGFLVIVQMSRTRPPYVFYSKICSAKIQQMHRRSPMQKFDFNKAV